MITVYRAYGLRVVIFVDGHEPAHVHVFGDGHAKINLVGPDGAPDLVWCEGMSRGEVRRAMRDRDGAAGRAAGTLERDSWVN